MNACERQERIREALPTRPRYDRLQALLNVRKATKNNRNGQTSEGDGSGIGLRIVKRRKLSKNRKNEQRAMVDNLHIFMEL